MFHRRLALVCLTRRHNRIGLRGLDVAHAFRSMRWTGCFGRRSQSNDVIRCAMKSIVLVKVPALHLQRVDMKIRYEDVAHLVGFRSIPGISTTG